MGKTNLMPLLPCIAVLCAAGESAAQSFSSLKRKSAASYDNTLNFMLNNNDVSGMKQYLSSNPSMVNNASSTKEMPVSGNKPIVQMVPLLYDAVERTLQGTCSIEMCELIINAGADMNIACDGKTPIYLILDYIATHAKGQCGTAEKLLEALTGRKDFDVNCRHKSLLPPLAYLVRTNHSHLNRFDKDYISDKALKLLIEKGAPVNTCDSEGNSLMTFAIDTENEYLQTWFLQNGVSIEKQNRQGQDAMYIAINAGQTALVKQLIEKGYVLNIHTMKNDPAYIRKFTDTYDFLTERFANQVTVFDDIKLFINKYNDKFDLVKEKLYAVIDKMNRPTLGKIAVLMELTQCFSKKSIKEYYVSKETYKLLLKEVSAVSILTKNYNAIAQETFDNYLSSKFYGGGIHAWKGLTEDFPEEKAKIIAYTRRWLNACGDYHILKCPGEIQGEIHQLNTCISKLGTYISSEVPDEEGQRLARTYRETARNAISYYQTDLPAAQRYEEEIRSTFRKIAEAVRETTIIPKYEVEKRSGDGNYGVDIYMNDYGTTSISVHYDSDKGEYDRVGIFEMSHSSKTLSELVLKYVKYERFVAHWDDWYERKGPQRAEEVIELFKHYGIKEWYKIRY
jgi:hypothetical protein